MKSSKVSAKEAAFYANTSEVKKVIDELFKALMAPAGIRKRLIKWLFPEVVEVAEKLRQFYWQPSS